MVTEYEYVTKAEYKPVRIEIENIIRQAQKYLRKKYKITFQFQLIGSGKRHLITRVKNGNQGFDFDYNLIIAQPKEKAKTIKNWFIEAFNEATKGTSYKPPEDSTSVFTIKSVDQIMKKIKHSCDFAIVYYPSEDTDDGYMYLKNWKNGRYSFEQRQLSQDADRKLAVLLTFSDGWERIRKEYLILKCNNKDAEKHSFVLYLEAINNVYNQAQQQKRR